MAEIDVELKPLLPKQRQFIDLIVYQGLERVEAYCESHNKNMAECNPETLRVAASKLFYTPHINNYYHALMEEIRDNEVKKAVWTKEVATEKLVKLIEKAESEIYGDAENAGKPITMSRLNAILMPAKELNQMNGFNQTNLNVEGKLVQICGEDELKD